MSSRTDFRVSFCSTCLEDEIAGYALKRTWASRERKGKGRMEEEERREKGEGEGED